MGRTVVLPCPWGHSAVSFSISEHDTVLPHDRFSCATCKDGPFWDVPKAYIATRSIDAAFILVTSFILKPRWELA